MAEIVKTKYPSFPNVKFDQLLKGLKKSRWQVLCGDKAHWRIGVYSPEFGSLKEIKRFEKHSCPEFFILIQGKMSLALLSKKGKKSKVRVVELKPLQGILVKDWHMGFCPKGKFTGLALVVERDRFTTWYCKHEAA